MKNLGIVVFTLILPFLFPRTVEAHAFGKLYTLPVPFWMYLFGGAAALVISFLVIGFFVDKTGKEISYPSFNLSKLSPFSIFTKVWFLRIISFLSLILFALTVLSGLIGADQQLLNFNMTFFWIIFVLGFTYFTAIIGNVWTVLNPWKILIELFKKTTHMQENGRIIYPESLGYYPALIFYFLFVWIELVGKTTPYSLSLILILYTFINFLGVFLIGKKSWFENCEFFSVFFNLLGHTSLIEYRSEKFYLRPPFMGLINQKAKHFSLLLFILFMLSSTAYDGFNETTLVYKVYRQYFVHRFSHPSFQTAGLFLSPFFFLVIYLVLIWCAKALTKKRISVIKLSFNFAYSLVPIALVYNIAHYYTLLLTQGQAIIHIISDPFVFNWNLFGTARFKPNLGIIGANFIWNSQVILILVGHVSAVYLSHVIALRVFKSHRKALISQFPMLLLMVLYTIIGLWILSQPITSGF